MNLQLEIDQLKTDVNQGWVLLSTFIVFMMQTGFSMLEAGSVRAKNTKNILIKNITDTFVSALVWWLIGYAFAYGDGNAFIGTSDFLVLQSDDYVIWLFQWVFATAAVTIVSGAMAERTQMIAYIVYTCIMTLIIYPLVARWVWDSQGWLGDIGENGVLDFAGGLPVHVTGAVVGLVGAIFLGPRSGRFLADGGGVNEMHGHAFPLTALGFWLLWFGWYAFNCGSTLAIADGASNLAGRVAVVTTLGPAAAGITVLALVRVLTGRFDLSVGMNGALAGLVAITAAANIIDVWASTVIGIVGALIYWLVSRLMLWLRIDDPLDAVAVHGGCGLWGVLAVGLFGTRQYVADALGVHKDSVQQYGGFYGGGGVQFGVQLLGCVVTIAWAGTWAIATFGALRHFVLLRVDHDTELAGLDNSKYGGSAYTDFELKAH
jgi:ammonium transporter, Amt family